MTFFQEEVMKEKNKLKKFQIFKEKEEEINKYLAWKKAHGRMLLNSVSWFVSALQTAHAASMEELS